MAYYLPDTNILIRILRGHTGYAALLRQFAVEGHTLACCSVTVGEVLSGMKLREETTTRNLMGSLAFLPDSRAVAERTGLLRLKYCREGIILSFADTFLTATALEYDCTLITENRKDFPMPELRLYDLGNLAP